MSRFKYNPTKLDIEAYKNAMEKRKNINFILNPNALRTSCQITFWDQKTSIEIGENSILKGTITSSTYGATTNQHSLTIQLDNGVKIRRMARNIYKNLITHKQGEESLKMNFGLNTENRKGKTQK